jgi:hypothetical protein
MAYFNEIFLNYSLEIEAIEERYLDECILFLIEIRTQNQRIAQNKTVN